MGPPPPRQSIAGSPGFKKPARSQARCYRPGAMRLPPGERLLSTDALVVGHDGTAILPPLSMTIAAGELWAVIGSNGSGKSTFVRTALGLVAPVGGKVEARSGLRLA